MKKIYNSYINWLIPVDYESVIIYDITNDSSIVDIKYEEGNNNIVKFFIVDYKNDIPNKEIYINVP